MKKLWPVLTTLALLGCDEPAKPPGAALKAGWVPGSFRACVTLENPVAGLEALPVHIYLEKKDYGVLPFPKTEQGYCKYFRPAWQEAPDSLLWVETADEHVVSQVVISTAEYTKVTNPEESDFKSERAVHDLGRDNIKNTWVIRIEVYHKLPSIFVNQ